MRYKNKKTGTVLSFGDGDKTLWRFGLVMMAFEKMIAILHLYFSFLTITLSGEHLEDDIKNIDDFLGLLQVRAKRLGHKIFYIKVVELQHHRFDEYGVVARHYHIVIVYNLFGMFPHCEYNPNASRWRRYRVVRDGSLIDIAWLKKNVKQKFGLFFICDGYGSLKKYLEKYLNENILSDQYRLLVGKKIRLFSASKISAKYFMSYDQQLEYDKLVSDIPEFENLYIHRSGRKFSLCVKQVPEISSNYVEKHFYRGKKRFVYQSLIHGSTFVSVHTIRTDWVLADPFVKFSPAEIDGQNQGENSGVD